MGGGTFVALYDSDAARVDVDEAEFTRNTAISAGGGLVVYANTSRDTNLRVAHSRFIDNMVEQGSGGSLVVVVGPPTDDENNIVVFYITNTTFTNNTVSSGTGGGLHVDGTSGVPKSCITHLFCFWIVMHALQQQTYMAFASKATAQLLEGACLPSTRSVPSPHPPSPVTRPPKQGAAAPTPRVSPACSSKTSISPATDTAHQC
jgi:hypothetical protein